MSRETMCRYTLVGRLSHGYRLVFQPTLSYTLSSSASSRHLAGSQSVRIRIPTRRPSRFPSSIRCDLDAFPGVRPATSPSEHGSQRRLWTTARKMAGAGRPKSARWTTASTRERSIRKRTTICTTRLIMFARRLGVGVVAFSPPGLCRYMCPQSHTAAAWLWRGATHWLLLTDCSHDHDIGIAIQVPTRQ